MDKFCTIPGEYGGYGNLGGSNASSSVYSSLPPPPMPTSHPPANLTTPTTTFVGVSPASGPSPIEGPLCSSSPKRCVSAFTTFGQAHNANNSAGDSPASFVVQGPSVIGQSPSSFGQGSVKSTPVPTTGHLV